MLENDQRKRGMLENDQRKRGMLENDQRKRGMLENDQLVDELVPLWRRGAHLICYLTCLSPTDPVHLFCLSFWTCPDISRISHILIEPGLRK